MEKVYKYILESIKQNKIEKSAAVQLIRFLRQEDPNREKDIAVIGMAVKLPSANSVKEYWHNIISGIDLIREFPETRAEDIGSYLKFMGIDENDIKYNSNAYLDEIDKFDYRFFRLTPREASLMDPNQRLFLQTAWHAVEDAGYGGRRIQGSNTGVYVGFANNLRDMYLRIVSEVEPEALTMSMVGNLPAVIAGRISYLLDLKGPSMVIDTACSSSLVAVSLACEAIRSGHCEMAIAGGIRLNLVPLDRENMKIGIESSDTKTRAFDDNSDGAGIGEGMGAILLKPLSKALKDQDNIHAVIKGYAVNQDGSSAGITAPNLNAQSEAIIRAWEDGDIDPEFVSYIETHGTGTRLGDPIEIKGIKKAFRKYTSKNMFCAIGSVKNNLGHMNEASGIAGFIKAAAALKSRQIPPTIYFSKPNMTIGFEDTPVYVNTKPRNWDTGKNPRICGVSAFGISGTNCHMVLQEAPEAENNRDPYRGYQVFTVSAKSEDALKELVKSYRQYVETDETLKLTDICYTANTGRGHYNFRLAVIVRDIQDFKEKISGISNNGFSGDGIYHGFHKILEGNKTDGENGSITQDTKKELGMEAELKLESFIQSGFEDKPVLHEICGLYVKGADVDWEAIYKGQKARKTGLPLYPFERSRCWIEIPGRKENKCDLDKEHLYFSMFWKPVEVNPKSLSTGNGPVLVFRGNDFRSGELVKSLRAIGSEVIEVFPGNMYRKTGENRYEMEGKEEDYDILLHDVGGYGISRIIHMMALSGTDEINTVDELKDSQKTRVYSMLYLSRALVRGGIEQGANISVIAPYVYSVTGEEERINPENAPLFGIGKTIVQEHPGISIRCIDIDNKTGEDDIIRETMVRSMEFQIAYRYGKRYMEEFREVEIESADKEKTRVKEDGVYVITGGTGGIGLEMAKYLARKEKIRLALISRSKMPAFNEWDDILHKKEDEKLCKKIKAINEIKSYGAEVVLISADVSDENRMIDALNGLRKNYGKINGIIHGAGIPGNGFLFRKEIEKFNEVLFPKIYGTWILDNATKEDNLDFFIMFSSGLSILSEPGHGDYTAANSYLDSFAAYRSMRGKKTLSINWVSWKETGMAFEHGFNYDSSFKAIPTRLAITGFDRVLERKVRNVLIGELSYNRQFIYLLDRLPFKLSEKISRCVNKIKQEYGISKKTIEEGKSWNTAGVLKLMGKEEINFTESERKLAQIYSEILGFKELNVFDNIFELGADSVTLMMLHTRAEVEFPGKVKLIDFFNYTSIASMSQYIDGILKN